ncbi:hypothetical protein SFRURICE_020164, partial [Spodoptera frugiperda]
KQVEATGVSESRLQRLARMRPLEPRSTGAVRETIPAACCMPACMLHACWHATWLLAYLLEKNNILKYILLTMEFLVRSSPFEATVWNEQHIITDILTDNSISTFQKCLI